MRWSDPLVAHMRDADHGSHDVRDRSSAAWGCETREASCYPSRAKSSSKPLKNISLPLSDSLRQYWRR